VSGFSGVLKRFFPRRALPKNCKQGPICGCFLSRKASHPCWGGSVVPPANRKGPMGL